MRAEVKNINFNAVKSGKNNKNYTGVEFTYQPEPYQGQVKDPVSRFLFNTSPIIESLRGLSIGDWVEITFDNTQYKNPQTCTKINPPNVETKSTGVSGYKPKDDETQLRIARAVALKAGVDLVNTLIANGAGKVKKTSESEIYGDEVIKLARQFEGYLTLQDDTEELESSIESVGETESLEQPLFDM